MPTNDNAALYILGDRGQTVDGPENDVRGRQVKDENGDGIGKVADLLIDSRENNVRFLLIEHGGFLGLRKTKTLIPVDAVTKITDGEVSVDQSRDRVASAPSYNPGLVKDRPYHSRIYGHYGYQPYWAPGYVYPMVIVPKSTPPAKN